MNENCRSLSNVFADLFCERQCECQVAGRAAQANTIQSTMKLSTLIYFFASSCQSEASEQNPALKTIIRTKLAENLQQQ